MNKLILILCMLITASGSAQKPTTKNDSVKTFLNTSIKFNVLLNDVDPNNDQLYLTRCVIKSSSYTIADGATKTATVTGGVLKIASTGLVEFIPTKDYLGNVEFTYTANDGRAGDGRTAKVFIQVIKKPRDTNLYSFSTNALTIIEVRKDSCRAGGNYFATIKKDVIIDGKEVTWVYSGWVMMTLWNDEAAYKLFQNGPKQTLVIPLTEFEYFLIAQHGCKR